MNGSEEFFRQLTDEEIILVIRSGDYYPFEILFQRYTPLVKSTIKYLYIQGFERDDFIQEARIVFNKSIQHYDKERGHTFGNYFKLNLRNQMFSLIRKDMAKKRRSEKVSESLEGLLESGFSPTYIQNYSSDMSIYQTLEVKESIPRYFDSLSDFEHQIFVRYLRNIDNEEIAKEFNCKPIQVINALDRCKRKMKMYIS